MKYNILSINTNEFFVLMNIILAIEYFIKKRNFEKI